MDPAVVLFALSGSTMTYIIVVLEVLLGSGLHWPIRIADAISPDRISPGNSSWQLQGNDEPGLKLEK
jgi:hypothetical protein